jgi:hypothetical protein
MSEAASAAPTSAPDTSTVPASAAPAGTAANDNAAPASPVAANDNGGGAPPTLDDVLHAENLAEDLAGKKWRLKHGEQERVVDTRELLRLGQIGHAGYEAFRKASELEKTVQAREEQIRGKLATLQQRLSEDPYETLVQLGYEDQLLASIERRVQYQQMAPEQRQRADIERERQRFEQERQAFQRQQQEQQRQQQEHAIRAQAQQAEATFRQQYNAALDAVGMPADPDLRGEAIMRMAAEHERLFNANVPIEVIARTVHERMQKIGTAFRPPPEKAREAFGEDYVRQLQQADVQRLQQPRAPNGQFVPNGGAKPAQSAEPKRQVFTSMRDFRKLMDGK